MNQLNTLHSLIGSLADHGDQPAILALTSEGQVCWTYARLADCVQQLAHGLRESGLGRGDHVALIADNRPEWLAAGLAVIATGAVLVPLDVQLADETLEHILDDSASHWIITTNEHVERLEQLADNAERQLILLDAPPDDARSWQQLLTPADSALPQAEPDDPAILFYTSGTTGPPKGVPLSHRNLVVQPAALADTPLLKARDRVLQPLPPHHVYPLVIGMLTPLACGLTIVLPQSLTGPQLVRALREGEVNIIIGVPRLYNALYEGIQSRTRSTSRVAAALVKAGINLSTWVVRHTKLRAGPLLLRPLHKQFGPKLRVLASGGAAIDPELAWKLEGLGWQVAIGYGLTETAPLLTFHLPGEGRLDSVGRAVPGVELRIDPSARPESEAEQAQEEDHERGEVLARGPNIFAGYHHLPDKTAEIFTEDGWFRTGDMGYFDDAGYLHVTGRVSTLIVTESGKNIQPDVVEAAYDQNPSIRETGVLQHDGQLVALIVPDVGAIRQQGDSDVDQAIRTAVDEQSRQLPSYQRIGDYAVTRSALPRTRLGKLRRHLLAEQYQQAKQAAQQPDAADAQPMDIADMSGDDRALLENPAARQVWEWLTEHYADLPLSPDTNLHLDLGIDSLEWLNLTMEIGQRAGVELGEDAIDRVDSIRDLLHEVAEQAEAGTPAEQPQPLEQPEEVLSERQKRWLEPLGPGMAMLARGFYTLNWGVMHSAFRLSVHGMEHVPREGPVIFAPNHASYLDAFVVAAALHYRQLRQTYWAASADIAFHNPLNRLVSRLGQAFPVKSRRSVVSSLAFGAGVLQRGKSLILFPEGRRSHTGELQDFKPGIGMLLDHFHVPVVPVNIEGTFAVYPPGRFLPRPGKVRVTFGRPLSANELAQQGHGDEPHDRIAQALQAHVAALQADGHDDSSVEQLQQHS